MDVTVLAYDIALNHLTVEDVCNAICIVVACENLKVAVAARHSHVIVQHILARQMNHRRNGIVEHGQYRVPASLKA